MMSAEVSAVGERESFIIEVPQLVYVDANGEPISDKEGDGEARQPG